MDPIDDALATADRAWRQHGVQRADREALAADLRLDLESAAADGVAPERLLGEDVSTFARRLADEAGVRREPPELGRLIGTTLTGAALGAAVGYAFFVLFFQVAARTFDMPRGTHVPVQVAVAVFYGIPAVIVVVGAVTAVRYHLRALPRIRATVHAMCLLLPLAGIVITPITMGFAALTGFSTWAPVVLTEMLLVLAALAGATVLARRWALREQAGMRQTSTA
ncbi:hypothetical protein AB0C12_28950 [Actinoplanes sp. NPDC048967]|uniref:hypothetical protein n=1 Tax=Actinoplanes sp. NPDC048967 TaxID=3155269 RepID=UPI0033CEEB53